MSIDSSFSRPERSSARTSEGGGGVTSSLTNAANQVYQNAPDLGVGATISSYLGQGQGQERGQPTTGKQGVAFDEQEDDRVQRTTNNKRTADLSPKQKDNGNDKGETPRQVSERTGPSDKSRVGKSQFEIGTETGIPTSSGQGTTASPDKTNQKAIEKADSQGKIYKAHIPEDYEPLSASGDRSFGSEHSRRSSANHGGGGGRSASQEHSSGGGSRKTSGNYATPTAPDGSPLEMEKRRSFGEKIKDQVKGEIKILTGTVTGSDDKILQGLAIKHGDHAA